ncbi:MAG: caspase family protein [Saprospiraceae bacterium]|nr:caspase family protein [Saprospiraceae bacterium]
MSFRFCKSFFIIAILGLCSVNSVNSQAQKATKKALLIGIGKYPEQGGWATINSSNDLGLLRESLQAQGFNKENILELSEERATKANILKMIKVDFTSKLSKGDIAYFHFSGHGQQMQDKNGDEVDGLDECIVPFDSPKKYVEGQYEGERLISDDELNGALTDVRKKLGPNGHLIVLLDACHSGTGTRGSALARGTTEIMASKNYTANLNKKSLTKEFKQTEQDGSNASAAGLAPFVAFFGAAQNQLNYEMTDDKKVSYGSLSYAFSKNLVQIGQETSYRGLFDKIRNEMASIAPLQNPQAEGDLDMEVLNGKALANADYYKVLSVIGPDQVFINAGQLHNLFDNSKVGFYPIDTRDIEKAHPLVTGTVILSKPAQSKVKLDSIIDPELLKTSWVFVLEKNMGETKVSLRILVNDQTLNTTIQEKLASFPFIEFKQESSNLSIEFDNLNSKKLYLKTFDNYYLDSLEVTPTRELNLKSFVAKIKKYAQGRFIRKLEMQGQDLKLSFKIIPSSTNQNITNVDELKELTPDSFGVKKLKVGESFHILVVNNGLKPAFFTILDIQPDNYSKVIVPGEHQTPEEFRILPDQKLFIKDPWEIGPPLGNEVFKLIASDKPMDLRSVFGTRGGIEQSPFEKLYKETMSDEVIGTRGSRVLNLGSSEIDINKESFLIYE